MLGASSSDGQFSVQETQWHNGDADATIKKEKSLGGNLWTLDARLFDQRAAMSINRAAGQTRWMFRWVTEKRVQVQAEWGEERGCWRDEGNGLVKESKPRGVEVIIGSGGRSGVGGWWLARQEADGGMMYGGARASFDTTRTDDRASKDDWVPDLCKARRTRMWQGGGEGYLFSARQAARLGRWAGHSCSRAVWQSCHDACRRGLGLRVSRARTHAWSEGEMATDMGGDTGKLATGNGP